jgi:NTE family protein
MKVALVVSGGGAKGAYAAGAVKYLATQGCTNFDIYAGTSTGALVTTLALAGNYREMELRYTTGNIPDYMQPLDLQGVKEHRGLVDTRPFRQTLETVYTEAVAARVFAAAAPQLILTAVRLRTGRLVYFHTGNPPAEARWTEPWETWQALGHASPAQAREQLLQVLQASGSEPVKFPAVKLWLDGDWYVDGGARTYAPIKSALAAGATEVFVVLHSAPSSDLTTSKESVENFFGVVGQTLEIFLSNTLAMDLAQARALAGGVEIAGRIVAPQQPIGGVAGGPNTFGRPIFERGFADAKRVWGPLLEQRPELRQHLGGTRGRGAGGPELIAGDDGRPRAARVRTAAAATRLDADLTAFWEATRPTRLPKRKTRRKPARKKAAKKKPRRKAVRRGS